MKRFTLLALFTVLVGSAVVFSQTENKNIDHCFASAGEDVTYLKDFVVKLPAKKNNQSPLVVKNTVILRKNTIYRFTICNNKNSEGKGIIQLFDVKRTLGSTYNPKTGKSYQSFNFHCSKTGPYTIFISFKDGKSGNAIGIMSYVKRK